MVENTPKLTYIIGYRHNPDRIINLRRVIDWISGFSGVQLIIVEQDSSPKIEHLAFKGKYIFTKSTLPYNRSWAFNVGLKNTKTSLVAFGDSDIIMNPYNFMDSVNKLEEYDVVSPYISVIDLDPGESTLDFEKMFFINRKGRGEEDNQKINICGGIVLFKTEAVISIGGWGENHFIGWGGEDDFQTLKINKMNLKSIEMPFKSYHLWHDRSTPDMTNYERTLENLNYFMGLDKNSLELQIRKDALNIGMANKYS